ncbi:MAG: hypothetical protein ACTSU4_08325 [Promethearchaeota archaeon]
MDDNKALKKHLVKCRTCDNYYFKHELIPCDICQEFHCPECTIIAGRKGTTCRTCFNDLPEAEQKEIAALAKKLRFWAGKGYYFLIVLVAATMFSFSLILLNRWFFLVGLVLVVIDFFYGYRLFKFLSNG